jgi:AraC-like DNA-binding protein
MICLFKDLFIYFADDVRVVCKVFDKLLEAGCTQARIAAAMGVDQNTLHDRFLKQYGENYTDYSGKKARYGEALIEYTQFQKAVKDKNVQMLMHLGKVRLGQKDAPSDATAADEIKDQYKALMRQLSAMQDQSALSIADNNNSNELKS